MFRGLLGKVTRRFNWDKGLPYKAMRGDDKALTAMFETFVGKQEVLADCAYLGVRGMWGFGHHCFAAVTDRRFATITISPFRGVYYQDIFADRIDRVRFHQPSGLVYLASALGVSFSALDLLLRIVAEEDGGLWGALSDADGPEQGWSLLVLCLALALILPLMWYLILSATRRIVKRGIECRSRNVCVDVFCDTTLTASGLRLVRAIAQLREHRLKMVLAQ